MLFFFATHAMLPNFTWPLLSNFKRSYCAVIHRKSTYYKHIKLIKYVYSYFLLLPQCCQTSVTTNAKFNYDSQSIGMHNYRQKVKLLSPFLWLQFSSHTLLPRFIWFIQYGVQSNLLSTACGQLTQHTSFHQYHNIYDWQCFQLAWFVHACTQLFRHVSSSCCLSTHTKYAKWVQNKAN